MSVLRQRIKELAERHGSIRAAARVLEVDHAYLYRLSTGEKDDPGAALLRKLKLRRVVSYEPAPLQGALEVKLPPMPELPTPNYESAHDDAPLTDHWSESQVRAMLLAYGAAVREECAKVCDLLAHEDTTCQGDMADLYKFGEAIREDGE